MSDPAEPRPAPALPLFAFAAIDLVLALVLLIDGGFTLHFGLILLVGLVLTVLGFLALRKNALPE